MRVKNWENFQHYKDRNPPWIKLATDLFQDYEFSTLSDASKLLAVCIWTLASRYKDPKLGIVPDDIEWIKNQCGLGDTINEECMQELENAGFISRDSNALAPCKQLARPETETETETETDIGRAYSLYNLTAEKCKIPKAQRLTQTRKSKIKARLKDCGGLEGWKSALEKVEASKFCQGKNDHGWKADLDFLLQETSFTRLMEGRYDGTNTATTKTNRAKEAIARANASISGM